MRDWERASPETDGWERLCGVAATAVPAAVCNRPVVKIGNCDVWQAEVSSFEGSDFYLPRTSFKASLSPRLAAAAVFFFFFPPCAVIDFSAWHRLHILDSAVR